ncbi:hypothetical protein HZ326_5000 [Fusarium oxysporum f. sp. albedinis]|nr:hypothetical protein HZ326_5000 [Fusarium oxysporum f. sp. albedinis]
MYLITRPLITCITISIAILSFEIFHLASLSLVRVELQCGGDPAARTRLRIQLMMAFIGHHTIANTLPIGLYFFLLRQWHKMLV